MLLPSFWPGNPSFLLLWVSSCPDPYPASDPELRRDQGGFIPRDPLKSASANYAPAIGGGTPSSRPV